MTLRERWEQRRRMNHAMRELAKPHKLINGEHEGRLVPGYPSWAKWLKKTGSEWPAQ